MATFEVVENHRRVILRTDDWVEAELASSGKNWTRYTMLTIRGTHPSHDWDDQYPRRCRKCAGWDNGSYPSHAPCGYDFAGGSLAAALEREVASRTQSASSGAGGE